MPAIITHDLFGKDVYAACAHAIGPGAEARQAFLLGNQGPDPLFYLALHPLRMRKHLKLGTAMHRTNVGELLAAFKECLGALAENDQEIGRAYIAGFLCHYLLDTTAHPFVYALQDACCEAGVPDLDESDSGRVHMLIERELDEIALFSRLGQTVETYKPHEEILQANDEILRIIGRLFAAATAKHFGIKPTPALYPLGVKGFRMGQRFFYSHKKARGRIVPALETAVTRSRYSFYRSLSHRSNPSTRSIFDNREGMEWANPFTGELSTLGFWDLYRQAFATAAKAVPRYLSPDCSTEEIRGMANNIDFRGKPLPS